MSDMLPVEEVKEKMLGFERVELIPGTTYKDNSTVIIIPTRGTIHYKVVQAWQNLIAPMNQKRAIFFAVGQEVGKAYDSMVEMVLNHPELSKWEFVLTLEDDNVVSPDMHIRLLESIRLGPFDAVSGIYFTKGPVNMPQAYGDPAEFARTGVLDFRPRNIVECLQAGQVMEVNGIAMGCSLYRMSLLRDVPAPRFVTCNDIIPEKGVSCYTQDLYFCEKARRIGKRFAVDMRAKSGHLDTTDGTVY